MKKNEYLQMAHLEQVHWWFRGKRSLAGVFLRQFFQPSSAHILDVGSGTGGMLPFLSQWGKVRGIEQYSLAVSSAQQKNLSVQQGNAHDLPFIAKTFDLVTFFDVLYHRDIDEYKALKEAKRVLKPHGFLLITDSAMPGLWSSHDVAMHAKKRFTLNEMVELVESQGFSVLRSSYMFAFTFPLFVFTRTLGRHTQKKRYVESLPFLLNELLFWVIKVESFFLQWMQFPFGSSVIVIAQKK